MPFEWFTKPIILKVLVNNREVTSRVLYAGNFSRDVPIEIPINSRSFQLKFVTDGFIVPQQIYPKSIDNRHLAIKVSSISIKGIPPVEESIVPVSATQSNFHQKGSEVTGEVSVSKEAQLVQLPVLFYPHLLKIKVDDKIVKYSAIPLPYTYTLVGLRLPLGTHRISASFVGLRWANWVSGIAWVIVTMSLATPPIVKKLRQLTTL